jgi:hypothetical protein
MLQPITPFPAPSAQAVLSTIRRALNFCTLPVTVVPRLGHELDVAREDRGPFEKGANDFVDKINNFRTGGLSKLNKSPIRPERGTAMTRVRALRRRHPLRLSTTSKCTPSAHPVLAKRRQYRQ